MAVCKFYRQGNCKFGDRCKFEHPPGLGPSQPAQTQNQNRYSGLSQNAAPQDHRGQGPGRDSRDHRNPRDLRPYGVTREILDEDLRRERPIWIMSGYGPGKDADIQLFGGFPMEQSPEEVRTLHYQAVATGNVQQSAQMEAEFAAKSNEQVQAVLNDVDGALQYLSNGANQHPNRNDICKAGTSNLQRNGNGPFSRSTRHGQINAERRAAGQAAATGFQQQQQTGFSQPTPAIQPPRFGATNQDPPASFGGGAQPVGFGQQPQPQPQAPAFGQNPPGAFGTQPAPGGFGAPAAPPSGQQYGAQPNPAFGQQQNLGFGFGQPQQQPQTNGVGFGQPGMQQQAPAGFNGATQQQQQPPQNAPLFGAQVNQHPAQLSQQAQQPGGFFAQPQAPTANGFSQQQQQQPQQPAGGFGAAPPANGDVQSYTTHDASNKLLTWKGRPVNYINGDGKTPTPCYRRDDGSWERIWFPDGPTGSQASLANGAAGAAEYPGAVTDAYGALKDSGQFKDGVVPDIAPSADMVRWDI